MSSEMGLGRLDVLQERAGRLRLTNFWAAAERGIDLLERRCALQTFPDRSNLRGGNLQGRMRPRSIREYPRLLSALHTSPRICTPAAKGLLHELRHGVVEGIGNSVLELLVAVAAVIEVTARHVVPDKLGRCGD